MAETVSLALAGVLFQFVALLCSLKGTKANLRTWEEFYPELPMRVGI